MKAIADQLGVTQDPRRRRAASGRPRARHRPVDRRSDRCASLGGELRPGTHRRQYLCHPKRSRRRHRRRPEGLADCWRAGAHRRDPDAESGGLAGLPARHAAHGEAHQLRRSPTAEGCFRKAIALDPKFALAWVGLADTLMLQVDLQRPTEDLPRSTRLSRPSAGSGAEPKSRRSWASAGVIAGHRLQFERAEQDVAPGDCAQPELRAGASLVEPILADTGRRDEALAAAERAVALDPLSADHQQLVGRSRVETWVASMMRSPRSDRRSRSIRRLPSPVLQHWRCFTRTGSDASTRRVPWFEKAASLDPGDPRSSAALAELYLASRR